MNTLADVLGEEVKQKIEEGGDWFGVKVEDGRFEGTLVNLNVDDVEIDNCDISDGVITVTVRGSGDVEYKDGDSKDQSENCDVVVSAEVNIGVMNHQSHTAQVKISVIILGVDNA
jgi:hypothetical protein